MKTPITEDKAVSEIIGALLLFAIVSVLLTSFILWYVPSTSTNNEVNFQMDTESSLISLETKMLSQKINPGDSISENVPLGISGTPPFIPAESTNIYYSSNFNATLSYSLEMNYTKQIQKKVDSVVSCANTSSKNIMNNMEISEIDHYEVKFKENGLKAGRYWGVQINGVSKSSSPLTSSSSGILSFCLPRGEYTFRINSDSKSFKPDPARGIVFVNTSSLSIPVVFTCNLNQTVISGNFGEISDLSSNNFNHISPYYGNCAETNNSYGKKICLNNWLGNSSDEMRIGDINYYRLASQQFTVGSSYESVNYVEFMLEPNLEYGNQFMQGKSSLYINIGKSMWGSAVSGSGKVINLKRNTNTTSYTKGDIREKVNFANCILLGTQHPYIRNYYLNFWESVNESSTSSGKQNKTFGIKYDNNSVGFGYGPNEFLASSGNQPCVEGVDTAYAFAAQIKCNVSSYVDEGSIMHEFDCFNITGENMKSLSEPYFFLIGYNTTCGSSTLHITENGLPADTISNLGWKMCVGENSYSVNSNSLTIQDLCNFQYSIYIPNHGEYVPDIVNGVLSIHSGCNSLSINFTNPRSELKDASGISDQGIQCIKLTHPEQFNCISMYFFNFTHNELHNSPQNTRSYVKVSLYNTDSGLQFFKVSRIIKVDGTGYYNIHFFDRSYGNGAYRIHTGTYYLSASEVDRNGTPSASDNSGWGFTTSGGYDSYIREVSQDLVLKSANNSCDSIITPYYAIQPCLSKTTNQSFIYSIRYVNDEIFSNECQRIITRDISEGGAIISSGSTEFTHSSDFVLGDGMFFSTGSHGRELSVGELPLNLFINSNGTSMKSAIYGMKITGGIPTSESNTGSSYLSMRESYRDVHNLELMHSYACDNNTMIITGLNLMDYNYTIESHFANILGRSFYSMLEGIKGTPERFTVNAGFSFTAHKDLETIKNFKGDLKLNSFSCTELGFRIDSI